MEKSRLELGDKDTTKDVEMLNNSSKAAYTKFETDLGAKTFDNNCYYLKTETLD